MIKLEWRPVSLAPGRPEISTSLTPDETYELQRRSAIRCDVLEIGSAYGYSAVAMALGGAKVTAVDPHAWLASYTTMVQNLIAYDVLENVEIIQQDSWTALPQLFKEGRTFDLIWIDGDHEAHTVTHDVAWAVQLVRKGGTIACHDYDEATCPGVKQALDNWKTPPRLVDTLALYDWDSLGIGVDA